MKATDLMIGDFVISPEGITKIRGVDKYLVKLEGCEFETDVDMIYPIPLTSEILELNNFKKDPEYIDTYWRPDCRKFCFVKENDGWYFAFCYKGGHICIAEITYVHELQHLLKSCKIEKEIVL